MGDHEWAFYGWKEGAAHVFVGPNNIGDVWSIRKVTPQSMILLTEKPVELAVRAVQYSSRVGENVLDLFGGSGSTLIACEQTGRRAFLMEIDDQYADVIVDLEPVGLLVGQVDRPHDVLDRAAVGQLAADRDLLTTVALGVRPGVLRVLEDLEARRLAFHRSVLIPQVAVGDGLIAIGVVASRLERNSTSEAGFGYSPGARFGLEVEFLALSDTGETY